MSKTLKYVTGDVLLPIGDGNKLIIHCCNDLGLMGSGVAKALLTKWPSVKSEYVKWSKKNDFLLGEIQIVKVDEKIFVANMIGQHGIKSFDNQVPVRYDAIKSCLIKVADFSKINQATIHVPYKMGSDRAGGEWGIIEDLLIECLCREGILVVVYDLQGGRA